MTAVVHGHQQIEPLEADAKQFLLTPATVGFAGFSGAQLSR
jgi:hypothetical protein